MVGAPGRHRAAPARTGGARGRRGTATAACSRPACSRANRWRPRPTTSPRCGRHAVALGHVRGARRRGALARRALPCDRGPGADAGRDRLLGGRPRHLARAARRGASAGGPVARVRRARPRASGRRAARSRRAAHGDPVRGAIGRWLVGARAARARALRPGGHARGPGAARRAPRGVVSTAARGGSMWSTCAPTRIASEARTAPRPQSARRCWRRPPPAGSPW